MNFNPRDQLRVRISLNIEMLDARIASTLNKVIQNSYVKKKVSLEEQKAQKEDSVSTRKTHRLTWSTTTFAVNWCAHDTVSGLCWFILCYSSRRQWCPGIRYKMETKFYYLCQRFPTDDISGKLCTNWEHVSPRKSKPYWNCTDMEIHQKISMSDCQKLKTMVKRSCIGQKLRLRNFDAWHGFIWIRRQWSRIETRNMWRWRRKRYLLPVERKRPVFARRPLQFPPRHRRSCHKNQTSMPPHLLSHPCHKVEVCRRKEVSKAKVTMVPFFDNRLDIIWKVLARDHLVNIGVLPSVNFTKQKRDAKPGISVCSRIIRLMNNQTTSQRKATIRTKEEKSTTRILWLLWKLYQN